MQPPSDEEIKEIVTQFKHCNVCKLKLTESSDYYFDKKNESNVLCDTCFLNLDMKAKRAYQFVKFRIKLFGHLFSSLRKKV